MASSEHARRLSVVSDQKSTGESGKTKYIDWCVLNLSAAFNLKLPTYQILIPHLNFIEYLFFLKFFAFILFFILLGFWGFGLVSWA